MFIQFSNWQPDVDPVAANVLVDPSNNMVPTVRGYRGASSFLQVAGSTSLSATAVGLWYARRVDNQNLMFGGTSTMLYVRSGSSWNANVSAAVTVSAVSRWQFAQWGDLTFAGSLETQSLVTDTTTFTAIPQMPRFNIIDSCNEFIMLGDVEVSVTYSILSAVTVTPGTYHDRWWCSGVGNPLTYNPDTATQAATGRLTDVAGKLTCGRALGDRFVFYKQRGIYLGDYAGPPLIWTWALVDHERGTFGQQCVQPVDVFHFFVGTDDFYSFDGQQTRSIGAGIRNWFFNRLNRRYANFIISVHDEYNHLVYWWYPGEGSTGALNEFVCFHYPTGRWGRGVSTINAASSFYVDAMTWDQLWAGFQFDLIPNTTFDAAVFLSESFVPVFFDGTNALSTLHGPQMASTLQTSYGGDDAKTTLARRVRARWMQTPTTARFTPYRLMRQGEQPEPGITRDMYNARWDFTQQARWHSGRIQTTGNWETSGIDIEARNAGRE
jgi:hypothetical protein